MGLREKKAAQTRRRITDVAVLLFERDGYDATTMESIAERAEVGTTTLYRYFPTKERLLLDRFSEVLDLSSRLRARPADEPLGVALGEVLVDVARTIDDPDRHIALLRSLIDASPGPRARLWDDLLRARDDLAAAISEREGARADDLGVRATAAVALELLQIIDSDANGSPSPSRVEATQQALSHLARSTIHLPTLSDDLTAGHSTRTGGS